MTFAPTIGVMRWFSADNRTNASWPTLTCEISFGFTCASMMRSSPIGSSSRITAPDETTPTCGVEILLHYDAAHGGANLNPVDHVLGGADLLLDIIQIRLGFAQLLDRVTKCCRIHLGYLFVRLSDPLL